LRAVPSKETPLAAFKDYLRPKKKRPHVKVWEDVHKEAMGAIYQSM
jgi:hypothetical protein